MTDVTHTVSAKIDGTNVPATIDLAEMIIEDHLHLPDSCTLTFRDSTRTALKSVNARIGSTLEVAMTDSTSTAPAVLFKGEIVSLEAEIHHGTSFTIVRGYDKSHRLMRGTTTKGYVNQSYSDVAKLVAQNAGLTPDVQSTSERYKLVTQYNETDWEFLNRMASEVGYLVTVDDTRLKFRKPEAASAAPSSGDLNSTSDVLLTVGSNLVELRATVTGAQQVGNVEARGWDPTTKDVIKSTASVKTDSIDNTLKPATLASSFGSGKLITYETPMSTSSQLSDKAKALADELASTFTELEGVALGNTALRAGKAVRLTLAGPPFDGKYVLTTTRHQYDQHDGYRTAFTVSGHQERSLLGLTQSGTNDHRIAGALPGVIEDIKDPDNHGRVKLAFKWMADDYVTDWCRLVQAGAGKNRGWELTPEMGDEVLVAFQNGDIRQPYVLGGMYNGKDTPKIGNAITGGSSNVKQRAFTSRQGHQLIFFDDDSNLGITIMSGDSGYSVKLDQTNKKIIIKSKGDIEITTEGSGDIKLKAGGSIKMEATSGFEAKGQTVKVEGQASTEVKGAQVKIEGSGPTQVKGNPIQLN